MKVKNRILKYFTEEYDDLKEKDIKKKYLLSLSVIINLLFNIVYISFICYSRETKLINLLFLVISFVWSLISFLTAYKLHNGYGNILFGLNAFAILFMSKIWFVYL